jgi:hypothetical protein
VFAEVKDDGAYGVTCGDFGLMGLAFDATANAKAPSPFHNLVTLGVLKEPIFCFLLVDDRGGLLTVWRLTLAGLVFLSIPPFPAVALLGLGVCRCARSVLMMRCLCATRMLRV